MDWNTTYQLAEQHRHDLLKSAAEARLARTARKDGFFHGLVARFARTAPQPVAVAQVDTLPAPAERSVAA